MVLWGLFVIRTLGLVAINVCANQYKNTEVSLHKPFQRYFRGTKLLATRKAMPNVYNWVIWVTTPLSGTVCGS